MINATETLEQMSKEMGFENYIDFVEEFDGLGGIELAEKLMNKHACNVLDELRKRVDEVDTDYLVNFKAEIIANMNDIKKELCAE